MKTIKILLIFGATFFIGTVVHAEESSALTTLQYQSHIQEIGWESNWNSNGELSGTTGQSKRIEAVKISLSNQEYQGNVEYQSHIQGIGWESNWHSNGELSGTTGQSKRLEAIKIKLTGQLAEKYDIYYRVHVENLGWLDWASNGQRAGTAGYSYRIEAYQMILIKKGSAPPENITNNFYTKINLTYSSYVQEIGWQSHVDNNSVSGTVGQSKKLEAIKINLSQYEYNGTIMYSTYVEGNGWQDYVSSNKVSGTIGQSKKTEAIKIKLTEELAEQYDIYYRVHVSNYGWLDWVYNDNKTGLIGYEKQIEAIQIRIVKKDSEKKVNSDNVFYSSDPIIKYQTYVYNNGWQSYVDDGKTSGTIGKGTKLEALKLKVSDNEYAGTIMYSTYISANGWQDYVSNDSISGLINQSKRIEAVKIKLTEELAELYDIYYRVHVSNYGWLDWTKNDSETGVIGYKQQVEAIEIKLIEKNSQKMETGDNFVYKNFDYLNYTSHVQNIGWQSYVDDGEISGTIGQSKRLEAVKIKINNQSIGGSIEYSAHVQDIGWQSYVDDGEISGTIGQSKRLEAIKIKLTGELAEQYDVYYRTYLQDYGWLDWASNDEVAGSTGVGLRMESYQVVLVKKGSDAPGNTDLPYIKNGFISQDGNTYFIDNNGKKVTGFYTIAGVKYYFNNNGIMLYKNVQKTIDVSYYQGTINWDIVKNSDVDGAIVRMGYGTTDSGSPVLDAKFVYNVSQANMYGLLSGVYLYSYAINKISAETEASFVIKQLQANNIPKQVIIYYDLESNKYTQHLTRNDYDTIISTFVDKLSQAGYTARIYTYKNLAETKFSPYARGLTTWIAQYADICTYSGSYSGWQYTSTGSIIGINGNVDLSVFFY